MVAMAPAGDDVTMTRFSHAKDAAELGQRPMAVRDHDLDEGQAVVTALASAVDGGSWTRPPSTPPSSG
jgi:hypothetical protein